MKIQILTLFFVGLFMVHANAQSTVKEDRVIRDLMSRWKEANKNVEEIQGWRVQIIATTDRRQMEATKKKFETRFPEYTLHFYHNEPYYQLRAGAFLYNRKAQAFLFKMQEQFPGSILVTENVKPAELLSFNQ